MWLQQDECRWQNLNITRYRCEYFSVDSPADVHELTEQKTFTFIIHFMSLVFGHKGSNIKMFQSVVSM